MERDTVEPDSPSVTSSSIQSTEGSDCTRPVRISIPVYKGNDYDVSPINLDEYCGHWVCSSCTIWGYIFCYNRMSRYKRIEILWVWILLVSLSIGMGVGVGVYGVNKFSSAPTDMEIITEKYSTLFCEKLVLKSDEKFDAYRFAGDLPINRSRAELFKKEYSSYVEHGDIKYYHYYLLQWSQVQIVSCTHQLMDFYVLAGEHNFKRWKSNPDCLSCYIYKMAVKINGCFLDYDKFTLTVSETDTYYFVFINRNVSAWLTTKIHINRYLYDVNKASKLCSNTRHCHIRVDFASSEQVAYHLKPFMDSSDTVITSTCKARLVFYVIIFAAMPGCLGLILTIIVFFTCKDPVNKVQRRNRSRPTFSIADGETTPLIGSRSPSPTYMGNNVSCSYPPTYEEATS
ncbi:hypothetical protein LOTGIDRAFT_155732 [Lottia gigantea]|uniref:E3 ubiquitin-protein ligase APD1-4 middle domain-containing protein n=1 Tax=Lottia gigantea TaxID=225164 RepID=V3ZK04_LOTGI|nr:hypothetical protein LOTGIDRAFT_155732 [Lottia gigantea]ESO82715.1 hypothetical protein LOTGIDRAFT_155732 [Lottia gigantea]